MFLKIVQTVTHLLSIEYTSSMLGPSSDAFALQLINPIGVCLGVLPLPALLTLDALELAVVCVGDDLILSGMAAMI